VKRVETAGIARAQHDPDRAAVTHDERRRRAPPVDITQGSFDTLLLLGQRLAAGEAKVRAGAEPGLVALGVLALDVNEQSPLPLAPVAFAARIVLVARTSTTDAWNPQASSATTSSGSCRCSR